MKVSDIATNRHVISFHFHSTTHTQYGLHAVAMRTVASIIVAACLSAGCMGGEALDIVFLLDVLNSDVTSGFDRLLMFISDVIDRFPSIGRLATRVALVTYAEHAQVEIFLDDFDSNSDLQVTLPF